MHAQHWRHDDGPHPTLCVIHGFMGSPYLFNGLFFSLPWFYRSGYDVLLYTLPFHGSRAEKGSPFSGYGFFANGFAGFAEAMAQAVHDFRSVIDYLEFTGVDRIALTGMSLGGYTSALIASVDDRIQAVIPNVPVVTPDQTVDEWFPANKVVQLRQSAVASTDSELASAATQYSLAAELSAVGPQGPPADHHRSRRPARAAGAGRNAVGALGPLRVPLVPGQPHPARQPAGLPAPDDSLHARLHVRVASAPPTGQPTRSSSPAGSGLLGTSETARGARIQRGEQRALNAGLRESGRRIGARPDRSPASGRRIPRRSLGCAEVPVNSTAVHVSVGCDHTSVSRSASRSSTGIP